jgi:ribonuclease HII
MICGADEAGRGPCFGPLVVAGVTIEDESRLIKIGVRDSKQLTPKKRELLAQQIKEIAVQYELIAVPASDIDAMRKVMTLNEIEVSAFSKIIEKLKPTICYVDAADVNAIRFGNDILSRLSFQLTVISKHKADEIYPIVGAASILAKTTRDHEVRRIEQELKKTLDLPLGSGYPADPITIHFLKTWLETYNEVPPYVRQSWKTVQRLVEERGRRKLDDF